MQKVHLDMMHDGAVAVVSLDDGKGNVIDRIMMDELHAVMDDLKQNAAVKMITLEGAGKHFSFGASVEEHQKEFAGTMLSTFHGLFYAMLDLAVPVAARVSGQCLGGGLELAAMCHFIFADRTARFGQPEIALGVFAPAGSVILPAKIGLARAEALLISGMPITAEEAKAAGLVNEVFDDRKSMMAGTGAWIEKHILPRSASSLKHAVRAARSAFARTLTEELPALEARYVRELMNTHDANEGIRSFIEKRIPEWINH